MEKVALFYNPVSGLAGFAEKLDHIIYLCQEQGLIVVPFRIRNNEYILKTMKEIAHEKWHTIIASGGDGTLHQVANAMIRCGVQVPLAVFPEGTSNDVAHYLDIPEDEDEYCRLLTHSRLMPLDVGKIDDQYFVNVAAAGLITEAAHGVDQSVKNLFGRLAYVLKGIEMIPKFRSFSLYAEDADGNKYEEEIIFLMLLNSGVTGGFKFLKEEGLMCDGKMDLIAIKIANLQNIKQILLNLPTRKTINDELIFYCRSSRFKIDVEPSTSTDFDGEHGSRMPWEVEVIPNLLQLRIPEKREIEKPEEEPLIGVGSSQSAEEIFYRY